MNVFSIQFDLLFERDIAAAGDLPCAGDAGGDIETFALRKRVSGDFAGNRRARADEAHVPKQDIDELRQFVEGGLAEDASDFGDAWIVVLRLQQV